MHTGYHRRRAWELRLMLLLASFPLLLIATWLIALAGAPLLVLAALIALALAEFVGAWLIWQSKP
jgi:hypothetical protein